MKLFIFFLPFDWIVIQKLSKSYKCLNEIAILTPRFSFSFLAANPEVLGKVFRILSFDYMIATNVFPHQTFKFYSNEKHALIIRRGLPFKIKLVFNEKYDPDQYELSFLLLAGKTLFLCISFCLLLLFNSWWPLYL